MRADAQTLSVTFNNPEVDFYTIPQYQRPYTWELNNFEVLWDDLMDAFGEYEEAKKNGKETGYYFLGPMVFVLNKSNRSYDIIDGQQRTTTFHILLWYLLRFLTDETEKMRVKQILTFFDKEPKLKVSSKDISTFLKIRESDAEIEGKSKMAACANYFRRKIRELQHPNSFSAFLRDNTQFISIVADDYAKAWDLFIGLNGKGEPLNPTDLVKAFVCGRSDVGEEAGAIWEEKILPLKENSTSFLLFLTRFRAQKFITENSLFREMSNLFPNTISTLDIANFSETYFLFWMVPIETISKQFESEMKLSNEGKKSLKIIRDLGRRDVTTLLFQLAESFGRRSLFHEELLHIVASYQMRMSISRKRSRERNFISWFNSATFQQLADKGNFQGALEIIRQKLRADAPDDATFQSLVQLSGYQGSFATRIILRAHEEGDRGNKNIFDFQLEHLMPQTGTTHWFMASGLVNAEGKADEDAYSKLVNNIGNLFVIDPETNNEVKNFDFEVKQKFYQAHLQDWSVSRVTLERSAWTKEDIEQRSTQLALWAVNRWKI